MGILEASGGPFYFDLTDLQNCDINWIDSGAHFKHNRYYLNCWFNFILIADKCTFVKSLVIIIN